MDRRTILMPGQDLPTEAAAPRYSERDLYVSEKTADRPNAAWSQIQQARGLAVPDTDEQRSWTLELIKHASS